MRGKEEIAIDLLRCAVSHVSDVRLLGNVRADEIALLAAEQIMTCPSCGAEAWCNIDCSLCVVISALEAEEEKSNG
jgi:hypothetical protein